MIYFIESAKLVILKAEGCRPLKVGKPVVLKWVFVCVIRDTSQRMILVSKKIMRMPWPVGLPIQSGLNLLEDTVVSATSFRVNTIELPVAILC